MKHFLNIFLFVISFAWLVTFSCSDPVYLGDVTATPRVDHNVTFTGSNAKWTELSYSYKDKKGIVWYCCDRYGSKRSFLDSEKASRILSQGKVYGETWYSITAKVVLWLLIIAWAIITICTWTCYGEDFKYNDPPDGYRCFKYCAVHDICLLLNNGNYPSTSEFFGYEKVSDTIQS